MSVWLSLQEDHSMNLSTQHKWYLLCCLLVVGNVAVMWRLLFHLEDEKLHQIQEQRRLHLEETCANIKNKSTLEELINMNLDHLIVDDKHGMIYCYVPKVACTNWKKVLYILKQSQSAPYPDPLTISNEVAHSDNSLTFLNHFPIEERQARLKHYTKFLFVRDPFARLVSAYREKFLTHNQVFYYHYGREILQRYAHIPKPPMNVDEAFKLGIHLTFSQFLEYLTDPLTEKTYPYNEHWRQMHRLCYPCSIEYNFIGHQETLQEDAKFLLKLLDIDIAFPIWPETRNNASSVWDWFKAVPLEVRRKLYKIHELDFKMFGYAEPRRLLDDDP